MAKVFHSRRLGWLTAAAFAAAAAQTPAGARPLASASEGARWAKTDAILGGAPSALEAILAKQNGQPAIADAALRPASLSTPAMLPAIVRMPAGPSAGVLSGRPDVFGSVALRIDHTRLDARWRRVEQARLGGAPGRYAQSLADLGAIERLEAVNRYVNRRVRFVDDARQYGRADVWSAAGDTLARGRGDCEDFAIAKLQMLRRAGFTDRDLYLVIVKDLVSRSDHAVLVVRADGHMYVLDNGTNRLLESESIRDYRPILTFAATGRWTHGYRVTRQPIDIASAEAASAAPLAPASETQRSWSESLLAFNTGFSK